MDSASQKSQDRTLVDFLERIARRSGLRPALLAKAEDGFREWSYADLWEGSGRVAAMLQSHGLKKGDRAILWGPNSPRWALAFFGCLRAGVVVVPLDMRSGDQFVQRVVDRTQPKFVFASLETPDRPAELDAPECILEVLEEECEGLKSPEPVEIDSDDLVEVMFTSGTTGTPKGVMLTHRNLVANLQSARQVVPGEATDRLVSILPLSHMYEQMAGLLMPLSAGANVTYEPSRQPATLFKTLKDRKVTMLLLVPQALDLFMTGIEREVKRQGKERVWRWMMKLAPKLPVWARRRLFGSVHSQLGGQLRYIISGGAALDPALGAKWESLGVQVLQGYGATEASPVISSHTLESARYDSAGRPLPRVEVRIADDGEIQVRGPNVTVGYWEDPGQTAAVFDGDWYRTGDQGFLSVDGLLHIQGRTRDMIVLPSGLNVFPDDIETVLKRHEDVTDACVIGLARESRTEVHAVYTGIDQQQASQITKWANSQLGDHQRIRGFSVWPDVDFPRTHTMKIKKNEVADALMAQSNGAMATS
ncbi:MAG: AMP-binding protein [SAR202 cluster bacterium]|nr:AMP-binding protein [SAR202 cluster bacterium]MDP6714941.1 AMP-binding protein [SAR202 cluster bacterium]